MLQRSPVPLYHQLKEMLTDKIESGEWAPGHQLPTEAQLSAELAVSRATVRQAMQLLANQGLIERVQGRGTFVARPKIAHNLLSMFTSAADIARDGEVAKVRLHDLRRKRAPKRVAELLNLAAGENVWELRRSVLAGAEPIILITSWLPSAMFPDLDAKGLERRSMRSVLREAYGIDGGRQHKEVEVTILDEEEATLLAANVGMPALLVTYLSFNLDGRPYEFRKMVVRGDRSKYYADLEAPELLM